MKKFCAPDGLLRVMAAGSDMYFGSLHVCTGRTLVMVLRMDLVKDEHIRTGTQPESLFRDNAIASIQFH
jgi:hypothetical protein